MNDLEQKVVNPLRETLISKLGFTVDPEDQNGLYKNMSENFMLFFLHSKDAPFVLGFYHGNDKQFAPTQRKYLTEIMERPEFTQEFSDFLDWGEQWICKKFKYKDREPKDIIEYLFPRIESLVLTVNLLEIT